jgi:hypothetical protein
MILTGAPNQIYLSDVMTQTPVASLLKSSAVKAG